MTSTRKGLVIIYYGDGKGKTTAAMGLATRALGRGLKVHVIQFIKGTWTTGEMEALQKLGAGFEQMGKGFYKTMNDQLPPEEHQKAARNGFSRAIEIMKGERPTLSVIPDFVPESKEEKQKEKDLNSFYFLDSRLHGNDKKEGMSDRGQKGVDILVLDEVLRAVQEGLLSREDINRLIEQKPEKLHLVMTGHTVWPELIEQADMVSEMKKIKHPFDKGILAQIGVDF